MHIKLTMLSLKLTGLKSSEKHILTILCARADEDSMECWPSSSRLSQDSGLNIKTVLNAMNSLEDKKLIIKTGRMEGKTKSVYVYKISLPKIGCAQNLSAPYFSASTPKIGGAKHTQNRVLEGSSYKDIKKEGSSDALKTQRHQEMKTIKSILGM